MKLILATKNKGKVRELSDLLKDTGAEVLSLADFPGIITAPEDAPDFKGNALIKARHVAKETGLTAVSDDSGLIVDALGGRPGVMSARYSGEDATDKDNYMKLLEELKDISAKDRSAHFTCTVAFVEAVGPIRNEEMTFEGELKGEITTAPRGAGGFGYDPVFVPRGTKRTLAEMTPKEKNAISHRGQAIGKFADWLRNRDQRK